MNKEQYVRTQNVIVKKCECCGKSHTFPVEILFDIMVDVMAYTTMRTEIHDVLLNCPEKGKNIIISVPMTFSSTESFISIDGKE